MKYFLGIFKFFFYQRVSKLSLVDYKSKISKKAKLNIGCKFLKSKIDDYSYVGQFSTIVHSEIGKYCSIASNCMIGLANHPLENISTSQLFILKQNPTKYKWSKLSNFKAYETTRIGNDVWIGTKVIILGGIKVGNGAVIGAGAIVTKDVPDYAIVTGVPARIKRYRFDEKIIETLKEIQWWNMPDNELKERVSIFEKTNFSIEDLKSLK